MLRFFNYNFITLVEKNALEKQGIVRYYVQKAASNYELFA